MRKALPVLLALALVVALPLSASANTSIIPYPASSVTSPLSVEWEISLPSASDAPDITILHDNASSFISYEQIPTRPSQDPNRNFTVALFDGFSYEDPTISAFDRTKLRYINDHSILLTSDVTFALQDLYDAMDIQATIRTKPFVLNRDTAKLVLGLVWGEYGSSATTSADIILTVNAYDTAGDSYSYVRSLSANSVSETFDITSFLTNARNSIPQGKFFSHYIVEAQSDSVIPTIGSTSTLIGSIVSPDVRTLNDLIINTTKVDYSEFDLLGWLSASLDGFTGATLFSLGSVDITIGKLIGAVLGLSVFIAFLKKFAGG